jgi:phage-related protein
MNITPIVFYRTSTGNEPVREWLKALDSAERQILGNDLQAIQMGWATSDISEPLVKSFGDGLFESRSSLPRNRIGRIFFCLYERRIILLHGFIKKTQQTPDKEKELAKKRQKNLLNGRKL